MIQEEVLKELREKIGVGDFNLPIFCDKPIIFGSKQKQLFQNQHLLIKNFFNTVVLIAKKALYDENDNILKKILFSESMLGINQHFYKENSKFCWNIPLMYRTDQSINGKIFEIQSPGSGWGDIALMYKILSKKYPELYDKYEEFILDYSSFVKSVTCREYPNVAHFEDASSNPTSIKYLKAITSKNLNYWGLNGEVTLDNVNYVITHSVHSLFGLNFFEKYCRLAEESDLLFCIQPNFLFDQKAIYILPFLNETKSYFDDSVRELFPYTSYLHNDGFLLKNGEFIKIDDFVKLPSRERRYYLKYGGPNVNKNWGSRTVYRLSKNDCYKLLKEANECAKKGEIWIIQEDITDFSDSVNCDYSDDINKILKNNFHIKISAFHTAKKILGYKIMYRKHFKVHGQKDTYVGVGI